MTRYCPGWLRFALLALVIAAPWALIQGATSRSDTRMDQVAFQSLVRGFGAGPHVDLARCARCFDPRVSAVCIRRGDLIRGGEALCVDHSLSIFEFRNLDGDDARVD